MRHQHTVVSDTPGPQASKKESVSGVRPLSRSGEPLEAPFANGIRLEEAITIGRPLPELYSYWRDFRNLPSFCKYLEHVEFIDEKRSRWTAIGPADKPLTWEAAIIEETPNELISWRSFEGSSFQNAGSVRFKKAPADRGTEINLTFAYSPPAGPLGSLVAKLSGKDPAYILHEELRRFKQLMETGEIPTTDGQPSLENQ